MIVSTRQMRRLLKDKFEQAKKLGISYRTLDRRIKANKVIYYEIPKKNKKWFI